MARRPPGVSTSDRSAAKSALGAASVQYPKESLTTQLFCKRPGSHHTSLGRVSRGLRMQWLSITSGAKHEPSSPDSVLRRPIPLALSGDGVSHVFAFFLHPRCFSRRGLAKGVLAVSSSVLVSARVLSAPLFLPARSAERKFPILEECIASHDASE